MHVDWSSLEAIEPDAQAAHLHLILWINLNASRIADMTQNLIGESSSQHVSTLVETTFLFVHEIFLCGIVGRGEMAEHGTYRNGILMTETVDQFLHLWILETKAMHTRVNLDMHGIVGHTHALCLFDKSIQESETVNLWFQAILDNRTERRHLGIHHQVSLPIRNCRYRSRMP